jgi:hypothetical protein
MSERGNKFTVLATIREAVRKRKDMLFEDVQIKIEELQEMLGQNCEVLTKLSRCYILFRLIRKENQGEESSIGSKIGVDRI